ncbi:hypothetical protein IMZ48_38775 [Candidatus Bathyarchaeota archaeon]|nr:hypothetical protein [Candidatus Bathyarchaeota archaeon]
MDSKQLSLKSTHPPHAGGHAKVDNPKWKPAICFVDPISPKERKKTQTYSIIHVFDTIFACYENVPQSCLKTKKKRVGKKEKNEARNKEKTSTVRNGKSLQGYA